MDGLRVAMVELTAPDPAFDPPDPDFGQGRS